MYATPGENLKIPVKLKDVDVSRGCMLTSNKNTCKICYEFEAKITLLSLPEETPILSAGSKGLILHVHTAKEEIEIKKIKGVFDKETKKLNKKIKVLSSH